MPPTDRDEAVGAVPPGWPAVTARLCGWYAAHARDLPWRGPGVTPWGVLVSEVMLQQTQVSRVEPAYLDWLARWPTPASLAQASTGDAVRAWGRLGYPRRALRLHATAQAIVDRHQGEVPRELGELLALPGIGAYTARAVATFAYGGRHAVVDTNVRRVVARIVRGVADSPPSAVGDLRAVEPLLPVVPALAVTFSAAAMELGATVCTARAPRCEVCPVRADCAWHAGGRRPAETPVRRPQPWTGSDRQARGRLLELLRESPEPVPMVALHRAWAEPAQRDRALAGLLADGLVELRGDNEVALPG